ncbi:hypothetical protein SGJ90_003148 [Salmonella enterica]|nr:hypothetical protein [Salmonella enterica]
MNNKLPEWRKALNSAVENYQSTQAWYEENPDNPAAEQDMDAAEGDIEKLLKQYGVLIVLSLMDEIDELQERRKADSAEPAGYHVIKECGKVGCSVATLEEAEKTRDFWNKKWIIKPYFYAPPVQETGVYKDMLNIINLLENNEWAEHCTGTVLGSLLESEITRLVSKEQSAPVVPDGLRQALSNAGIAAPESDEMLAATCEKYIQMLVTWVKDRKPFQPAPVVPDGLKQAVEFYEQVKQENTPVETGAWKDAVNWVLDEARRAALLQANQRDLSQPVDPQISEYEKIMLQAGNSPVIPDGYVLVPVEPTDEMIVAAMDSDDVTYNESDDTVFYVHHREIYKAMLAAAPRQEVK